jgi:hypothetical protein
MGHKRGRKDPRDFTIEQLDLRVFEQEQEIKKLRRDLRECKSLIRDMSKWLEDLVFYAHAKTTRERLKLGKPERSRREAITEANDLVKVFKEIR